MAQLEMKHVDVQIQSSPDKFYDVFWNQTDNLHQMSPNYVMRVSLIKGERGTVGLKKVVVYYPEGRGPNRRTESFTDECVAANDLAKSVTFQVLEGEIMENYNSFFAELQVTTLGQCNWARWTVVYKKKSPFNPVPDRYLELLEKISKDVDDFLRSN